jgi:hypothetical protein
MNERITERRSTLRELYIKPYSYQIIQPELGLLGMGKGRGSNPPWISRKKIELNSNKKNIKY